MKIFTRQLNIEPTPHKVRGIGWIKVFELLANTVLVYTLNCVSATIILVPVLIVRYLVYSYCMYCTVYTIFSNLDFIKASPFQCLQELLALGAANTFQSFFQGFAVSASIVRTNTHNNSGGQTQVKLTPAA